MIVIGATGTSGFRPGDIFLVDDTTGWGHISPEAKKRGGRPFFYSETENLLPRVISTRNNLIYEFPRRCYRVGWAHDYSNLCPLCRFAFVGLNLAVTNRTARVRGYACRRRREENPGA